MAFNLDWLFKDDSEKDTRKDPLKKDRKSIRSKELPMENEEITEEEQRVLENDPELLKMHKLFNDYNAKVGFYGFDEDILDEISADAFDYGDDNLSLNSEREYSSSGL